MAKKKTYRGGVIPYFHDADGQLMMLFMKPSEKKFGGEEFQIAKGKVEEDEDNETAAFREAREELGLFKPNCAEVTCLGTFLGRTEIYHCRVEDPTDGMFGKPCSETAETRWLTPEEFQKQGRGLHKPVVKAVVRSIERQAPVITEYLDELEMLLRDDEAMEMLSEGTNLEMHPENGNGDIIATFSVGPSNFRCVLQRFMIPDIGVAGYNVEFGPIVARKRWFRKEKIDYGKQSNEEVNPHEVMSSVMQVIKLGLPKSANILCFAASPKNGDVEKRARGYRVMANRIAKVYPQFERILPMMTFGSGTQATLIVGKTITDHEVPAITKFLDHYFR